MEARIFGQFDLVLERFLGSKDDVNVARRAFADWKKLRDEEFRLVRAGGKDRSDEASLLAQQKYVNQLRDKTQVMIDFAARRAQSFRDSANEEIADARAAMIALVAAAILLSFGAAFVITRSITRPLGIIVRRMKDIARGDLAHDVEIVQKDEIGELAESFREMQNGLRNKAGVAMAKKQLRYSEDSHPEIIKELRCWVDACDQQMIAGARAGHVKQVALRVVDFFQV